MKCFEKESLGLFPTPMYRLPNISRELGTNVWIKREKRWTGRSTSWNQDCWEKYQ